MGKKNSAGKYRGRVQIGVDKDGKPINKYVSASTMRELEQKKEEVRHHFIEGEPIRDDMLFQTYTEEWYRLKKEPFISEAYKASYHVMLQKHIFPAFGLRHLRAVSAQELQEYINTFSGTSKSQITLAISILKDVFRNAYAEGIIERDPTVSLIRPKAQPKTERRALTDQETEYVLETIHRHPNGLLLAVLYYLGLRRGEALGLKWDDFNFDENQVHIQRDIDFVGSKAHDGALKTKAANRFIPVTAELREMLLPVRGFPGQYLFPNTHGGPLSQASFKRLWLSLMQDANCVEKCDLPEGALHPEDIRKPLKPTLTAHYFRHNFVTELYKHSVDPLLAMKIVGHTDYQTTANIYTHLDQESMRKVALSLDEIFDRKNAAKKAAEKMGVVSQIAGI